MELAYQIADVALRTLRGLDLERAGLVRHALAAGALSFRLLTIIRRGTQRFSPRLGCEKLDAREHAECGDAGGRRGVDREGLELANAMKTAAKKVAVRNSAEKIADLIESDLRG